MLVEEEFNLQYVCDIIIIAFLGSTRDLSPIHCVSPHEYDACYFH